MGAQEDKVYTRTNQDKEPVVLPSVVSQTSPGPLTRLKHVRKPWLS